jgi:hypothetical protein
MVITAVYVASICLMVFGFGVAVFRARRML